MSLSYEVHCESIGFVARYSYLSDARRVVLMLGRATHHIIQVVQTPLGIQVKTLVWRGDTFYCCTLKSSR